MARERKHPPRRKRRGRFRWIYKLISLVAVVAALVTACVIFFRVNGIHVEGNSHYTAQDIIAASGLETGDNLVTMWEPSINQRICAQLPYVQRVVLRRALPDQVTLMVVERTVAATIQGDGSSWLLSGDGYLLETTSQVQGLEVTCLQATSPKAGQELQVEESSQSKARALTRLISALEEAEKLGECTKVDCSAASSLAVTYGQHQLKFPLYGDYPYMLQLFQAALDSGKVPEGEALIFDFTVADREVYVQRPKATS